MKNWDEPLAVGPALDAVLARASGEVSEAPPGYVPYPSRPYSTDPAVAWGLVEVLGARGWYLSIGPTATEGIPPWYAHFDMRDRHCRDTYSYGATALEALCR